MAMVKWTKTNCERQGKAILFLCPGCHRRTELKIGPGDYSIAEHGIERGQVHPDYVCLHESNPGHGDYCQFAGPLWLINY
jgi:hypothetical protein